MGQCIDCGKATENPKAKCCISCATKRIYKRNPRLKEINDENIKKLETIKKMVGK